jgi:hypothetical protein
LEEKDVVLVRYEEEDDHGHSTLIFHGEPDVVAAIMASALLVLAAAAEDVERVELGEDESGLAEAA